MAEKSVHRQALARSPQHLSPEEIHGYFLATLDLAARERIEMHLCACAHCLQKGAAIIRESLNGDPPAAKAAAAR